MPTYAANNKQIARALGLKPRRAVLAEIGTWRARPDFPKRDRHGYRIAELQVWLPVSGVRGQAKKRKPDAPHAAAGNGALISDADKFSARLARNQDAYFNPDKYPTKLAKWEVDELRANGRIPDSEQAGKQTLALTPALSPGERERHSSPTGELPFLLVEKVTTQKAIVPELQRHYAGRLVNEITVQNVSDWLRGKNLPDPNAPVAPHKDGNYFYLRPWLEWFDQWILPYWQIGPADENVLFSPAEMARLRRDDEREALLHNKFIRDREQAGYIALDVARHTRRGMLKLALAKVRRGQENKDTQARADWIAAHLNPAPEKMLAWREFDLALARARMDAIYDDFEKHSAADPETAQAQAKE